MGKASAPKAPSPQATSAAQTGTNVATAIANQQLNNVNQVGPDGNLTFTNNGFETFTDTFTGKTYQIPKTTATTTLSPAQQAIKNQQDQASLGLSTLANTQTGFLQDYMGEPFKFDDNAHTEWATDLYGKINDQDFADQQQQAQSRLSNMGIKMGTPGYDREISRLESSQQKQRDQFLLDSYGQDFQTQQALRNQPINEITALMSGGQVSQPQFQSFNQGNIPTTDNAGIINQNYQNRVNAANQQNASMGGLFSGLGSAFGAVAPLMFSDETMKKNVEKVGTVNGQAWHEFNWKGEPKGAPMHMGLIAQKVERKTPDAVKTVGGKKMVDYGRALRMGA